jgi:toxin-antitoxin system PIN domain toxin
MPGLSFPDVNVWMAALLIDHIHHAVVQSWWESDDSESICFTRITQISVLRLLTTSTVMNGKPLTAKAAWRVYDKLFDDDRVAYVAEGAHAENYFRRYASESVPSPKVWADAWLLAVAASHNGTVLTLDSGLAYRSQSYPEQHCILLT